MSPPSPPSICFTVAAPPRAKARARTSFRHSKLRFYTPPATTEFEDAVRAAASTVVAGALPIIGPVDVHMIVRLAPCNSTSKGRARAMIEGQIVPSKAPDIDNIAKAVLDGCKGVAFADDRQVIRLVAEKTYAPSAGVDVRIVARAQVGG